MSEINGQWPKERLMVLDRLERVESSVNNLSVKIDEFIQREQDERVSIKVDLGRLNLKASVWGALAGILTVGVTLLLKGL